jgi:peptidoglycan/xylan/chitin deacetylase (PgdA/CDA1 family)
VILYHHLVSDRPHPLGLPTDAFVRHLRYLKRHYRIVSLDDAVALLASGAVGEPTIVLTMDDGYGDNFVNLRAALRAEPAPVALFVCSRLIAESRPFPHDVRDHREGFSPLTPEEVRSLAAEGITIGSPTRTHLDCGTHDHARLTDEIVGSRQDLEAMLNREVRYFAFPFGHRENMSPEAMAIASSAYRHHFSAHGGTNTVPAVALQHLRRMGWPVNLWELELALQGVLELRDLASLIDPAAPVVASGAGDPPVTGHETA